MAKKIIKILVIALVFSCIFMSIVMSQNTHHMDHCEVHNCPVCAMIMFAQIINKLLKITYIYINLIVLILVAFYISYKEKHKILRINSLIFQKVQFNE